MLHMPMMNCTKPLSKVRATAFRTLILSGWCMLVALDATSKDIIAVGPSVTSLELPNIAYTKQPMNDE